MARCMETIKNRITTENRNLTALEGESRSSWRIKRDYEAMCQCVGHGTAVWPDFTETDQTEEAEVSIVFQGRQTYHADWGMMFQFDQHLDSDLHLITFRNRLRLRTVESVNDFVGFQCRSL